MIVTVTANTTIDQTVFVPTFQKHRTMRATSSVLSMAGKPTDASWVLSEIGIPSLALGFAAGVVGDLVENMLRLRGVTTDFIRVGGESRLNMVIIDMADSTHSTITTSTLDVKPEHVEALCRRFGSALDGASCVVIGGTLPAAMAPDFYTQTIHMARERGVPVIFDAAEPNLSAGLASSPTYVKPNRDETEALLKTVIETPEAAYRAGRALLEQYGTAPIITLGDQGAVAVLPDRAYRIPPIRVDVVSAAGAGDAVLAGLAAAIHRKQPIEDGLRLGFAAATAACLMPGTGECRRADIEHFLPQVQLVPMDYA